MRRTYVSVTVDVDLAEIDTEDLERELESRRETLATDLEEIYYALKFGEDARALTLMRRYVCDQTGRVL